ncbi:hypothetical protein [Stutzerimonas stutzeri]|uniref:hypothetical protein n=1 Tax=Stutzerimonas stutzeri TaxID=316 RepID=UPI001C2E371E|nr:hypothetical protein [Stutzerimonas stutzeri]
MRKMLLIPTRAEWSTYSSDQKRGVAIYVITTVATLCSIILWLSIQISDKLSEFERAKLVGIWYSDYSWGSPSGDVTVVGTTQHLSNGNYNFAGDLSMKVDRPKQMSVVWHVNATGKWSLENDHLITQLIDLKSSIKRVSMDGLEPSMEKTIRPYLSSFRLESFFPSNLTESSTILKVGEMEIITEKSDLAGKPLVVKLIRVEAPFSSKIGE